MNYKEFAGKVKAKYPDYADMDDRELAQKLVNKYPKEYGDVAFDPIEANASALVPMAESAALSPAGSAAVNFVSEEMTPAAGAMLGAAASLPFAPAAGPFAPAVPIVGAAMGAMGTRGLQRSYQYMMGLKQPPTTGEAVSDLQSAGVAGALGEVGGNLLTRAAKAVAPAAKGLATQAIRGFAGIRESVAGPAVSNPSKLLTAVSPEDAAAGYKAFEGYTGLQGLTATEVARAKPFSPQEMLQQVYTTAGKIFRGADVDPQELYLTSQMAANLKRMARFQNPPPEVLSRAAAVDQSKGIIDDALGKVFPEYPSLRSDYAGAKTAEQFNSFFPLQRNLSPDAMRMMVPAMTGVSYGALSGDWQGALAPFALYSPLAYKGALLGTQAVGKAATSEGGKLFGRGAVQGLADAYNNRRMANAP